MSSILSGNSLTYLFALLLVMLECAAEVSAVDQISLPCKTKCRYFEKDHPQVCANPVYVV